MVPTTALCPSSQTPDAHSLAELTHWLKARRSEPPPPHAAPNKSTKTTRHAALGIITEQATWGLFAEQ